MTDENATPEDRIVALGLDLPPPPAPVGDYETSARVGDLLITSGMLPWISGNLQYSGIIGADLDVDRGYQAFRLSALNGIALLKHELGALSRVRRIVRVEGSMGCVPGFTGQAEVLNGASHVIEQIFGASGRHSRMVHSCSAMPMNCATIVVLYAEVDSR